VLRESLIRIFADLEDRDPLGGIRLRHADPGRYSGAAPARLRALDA